jgi:hypothetical protein
VIDLQTFAPDYEKQTAIQQDVFSELDKPTP